MPQKVATAFIFLLFYQFAYSQAELRPVMPEPDSVQTTRYNLLDNLSGSQLWVPGQSFISSPPFPVFSNLQNRFSFQNEPAFKTLTFTPNKIEWEMPGLGSVNHFSNQLRWNAGNNFSVDFAAGLAIQNTISNLYAPNYQLISQAQIEYSFNDKTSTYLRGQYLTKPLNKPSTFFDPFMYNNPLFLQNEIGAGFKTKYKNTTIDFQVISIYGPESVISNPGHSKIRIGF